MKQKHSKVSEWFQVTNRVKAKVKIRISSSSDSSTKYDLKIIST